MRFKTLLAGGAALAWMLLAQPALAATVEVDSDDALVLFTAGVGEVNDVTVLEEPEGVFVITDLGAAITSQADECVSVSPNTVRCGAPAGDLLGYQVDVSARDGADSVYVGSYGAFVHGGSGPDTLTGTNTGQTLVGGLDNDHLVGRAGTQMMSGGQGADSLEGGAGWDELEGGAGTDLIMGGPGEDTASFFDHTGSVRITLDGRANDGAAGENDWVGADVESADGSRGPTTFIGNAGPNTFVSFSDEGDVVRAGAGDDWVFVAGAPCSCAGDGPDVVWGGAGNDRLEGGKGRNLLLGGSGDDWLTGFGRADVLQGGPGNDRLNGQSGADELRGGRGRDRLSAGPQNDTLRGGPGRDHLLGNSGADVLYARDRSTDRVSGGLGDDRARVDRIDVLSFTEAIF